MTLFATLLDGAALEVRRFSYDAENRLTAVREMLGDQFLQIWYDALGRRIMTEDLTQIRGDCDTALGPLTTRHVYDGRRGAAGVLSRLRAGTSRLQTQGTASRYAQRFPQNAHAEHRASTPSASRPCPLPIGRPRKPRTRPPTRRRKEK